MAQALDKILERKVFQVGEVIFKEGDEGNRAFVVQAGEVEISKIKNGKKLVLGIVGPGGIFGEMALIDEAPRMANAVSLDVTTAILISRDMLNQKLAKADPFLRGLIGILANNVRSLAARRVDEEAEKG